MPPQVATASSARWRTHSDFSRARLPSCPQVPRRGLSTLRGSVLRRSTGTRPARRAQSRSSALCAIQDSGGCAESGRLAVASRFEAGSPSLANRLVDGGALDIRPAGAGSAVRARGVHLVVPRSIQESITPMVCTGSLRQSSAGPEALLARWHSSSAGAGFMKGFLNLMGMSAGGWLGWAIGAPISFYAAFIVSMVGTGIGLYVTQRALKRLLP